MKTYYTPNQMRLVGKGWEIRNYMKTALQLSPSGISMKDFMQGKCSNVFRETTALRRQLTDLGTERAERPHQLPYSPQRKKTDRRVIPFPSK